MFSSDNGVKSFRGDARHVLDAAHADLRLVAAVGHAGHDQAFHHFLLGHHPGSVLLVEGRAHVQRHAVAHREPHGADLQHLRAQARHLDHLIEGDPVELARGRHHVRVRREHAVHVGVDLADVGIERGGHGHGAGVGPAPPERRDVAVVVDALEAGQHGHAAALQRGEQLRPVDALDARAAVGRVGAHAHLGAGEGARRLTELLDRHRQQRDRLLLPGRHQHVEFARVGGRTAELLGQRHQRVGLPGHRRHHHRHPMAGARRLHHALRHGADALRAADAGAAVFLDDQAHGSGLGVDREVRDRLLREGLTPAREEALGAGARRLSRSRDAASPPPGAAP